MKGAERDFAAQVENQRCEEFMVQQFWHQGRMAGEWNVLFLKVATGWIRFFFDSGVFFWRQEAPSLPENHEENEYRLVKPQIATAIEGRTIVSATFSQLSSGGRTLSLHMDAGTALHFHNKNDRSSVVFLGGHAT